jgi:hypothetical protein
MDSGLRPLAGPGMTVERDAHCVPRALRLPRALALILMLRAAREARGVSKHEAPVMPERGLMVRDAPTPEASMHCVPAMALLTMRGRESRCCKRLVALRRTSSFSRGMSPPSFANCPSCKMRGRSAETALGCLRGTLWRTSHGGPQTLARRLAPLAIGMLASRRSTRGVCGLRPSERTMPVSTGPTSSRNLPALLARQRHRTPHRVLLKLMPRESTLGGRDGRRVAAYGGTSTKVRAIDSAC